MRKCTPREIIREVPDVQTVILPRNWFDYLGDKQSVFISLYEWMLENGCVPSGDKEGLHNRTYVGEKVYKKLLSTEKKRLRNKLKIKGDELDRALDWSDMNSGPNTEIGGCIISGDVILIIPETSIQALGEFSFKICIKQQDAAINKIRNHAAGATFYQWLLPQSDRPDPVGDIARDAVVDEKFPRSSVHYEEIKSYFNSLGERNAAIESLKMCWLEYIEKYPERLQPYAWCSECGNRIDVENALLAWNLESQEIFILDTACFTKFLEYDKLASRPLLGITYDNLKDLAVKKEVSELDAKEIVEQLQLWGIIPGTPEEYDLNAAISGKYTRRGMSNSKRYDVLRRDKFQCVLCGASGNDANLEVDHIVPITRGGTDKIGNLRCLCFKCNRGKHAKIE
jgi:uncharacterized protein YozE (UPF0346 family)